MLGASKIDMGGRDVLREIPEIWKQRRRPFGSRTAAGVEDERESGGRLTVHQQLIP
eukprot:COSAG05_NODE_2754_length_2682_cov_1.552846_5_plen_55_part_01